MSHQPEPVTLPGADGSVPASNAARGVLAVLPVHVILNAGRSPSLQPGDGSTLVFITRGLVPDAVERSLHAFHRLTRPAGVVA